MKLQQYRFYDWAWYDMNQTLPKGHKKLQLKFKCETLYSGVPPLK